MRRNRGRFRDLVVLALPPVLRLELQISADPLEVTPGRSPASTSAWFTQRGRLSLPTFTCSATACPRPWWWATSYGAPAPSAQPAPREQDRSSSACRLSLPDSNSSGIKQGSFHPKCARSGRARPVANRGRWSPRCRSPWPSSMIVGSALRVAHASKIRWPRCATGAPCAAGRRYDVSPALGSGERPVWAARSGN